MNISISNIAWNLKEDDDISKILHEYNISAIEIAPSKIWKNPTLIDNITFKEYKNYWLKKRIRIIAAQSILFGKNNLNIFKNKKNREDTFRYLTKMIEKISFLGAEKIVFGSPKNRKINKLKNNIVLEIASDFFYRLAEKAKIYNIYFCIEPNPKIYECDFITNTNQAVNLINQVNHPNFKLHLDAAILSLNKESYEKAISQNIKLLKHFHISSPWLGLIGEDNIVDHKKIVQILKYSKYKEWVSIEMKANILSSNIKSVEKVLKFVSDIYI